MLVILLLALGVIMFELIGGIILEGLKVFGEERRTRFMDEHNEIITKLSEAQNDMTSNYSDAAIDISEESLMNFMKSYHSELKGHNNESN